MTTAYKLTERQKQCLHGRKVHGWSPSSVSLTMRAGCAREVCRHCGAKRTITVTGLVTDFVNGRIPAPD